MPKARAAALRALELDETLAEAHTSLGAIKHLYEWDWAGAEREFQRALDLNRNYATAHQWYAEYLRMMGRHEESLRQMQRARELDPLSPIIHAGVGWCYYAAREFDQAIRECQKAVEITPDFGMASACLAEAYLEAGLVNENIAEVERWQTLRGRAPQEVTKGRRAYERGGLKGYWRFRLERARERIRKGEDQNLTFVAGGYARLGEKDAALAWLERAYEERDPALGDINVGVRFDSLRSDPRFKDLQRRMNFPQN